VNSKLLFTIAHNKNKIIFSSHLSALSLSLCHFLSLKIQNKDAVEKEKC